MGVNFLLITVCHACRCEGGRDSVGACRRPCLYMNILWNIFHNTQINNLHICIIETAFKMAWRGSWKITLKAPTSAQRQHMGVAQNIASEWKVVLVGDPKAGEWVTCSVVGV